MGDFDFARGVGARRSALEFNRFAHSTQGSRENTSRQGNSSGVIASDVPYLTCLSLLRAESPNSGDGVTGLSGSPRRNYTAFCVNNLLRNVRNELHQNGCRFSSIRFFLNFGFFLTFGATSPSAKPLKLFKRIRMDGFCQNVAKRLLQVPDV